MFFSQLVICLVSVWNNCLVLEIRGQQYGLIYLNSYHMQKTSTHIKILHLYKQITQYIYLTISLIILILTQKMGDPIKQFSQWYMSKSITSRLYLTYSILIFLSLYFNLLTIQHIYLTYDTLCSLQLWRLITAVAYQHAYSLLSYPIKLYISYSILVNLEEGVYGRKSAKVYAQFLWLVTLVWAICSVVVIGLELYVTNHFFFLCLCCIWAQKQPNSSLRLVLGITIPVYYLPYIYAVYFWAMGLLGFWIQLVVAFALSYLYYYLKVYALTHYGKDYFPTPTIFEIIVEKYLVIEKQWGIYKQINEEEEQNDDPYAQYGYYSDQSAR